jgi:hypothetical protein
MNMCVVYVCPRNLISCFSFIHNRRKQAAAAALLLLRGETERTRKLLEEDGDQGNNSVWCYRHGLLRRMLAFGPTDGETDGEWAYRLW